MSPSASELEGRWLWTGRRTSRCDAPGCAAAGRQWLYEVGGTRLPVSACRRCEASLMAAVAALARGGPARAPAAEALGGAAPGGPPPGQLP
jgi:hypothetical protein